jgi:hypothetical protein
MKNRRAAPAVLNIPNYYEIAVDIIEQPTQPKTPRK